MNKKAPLYIALIPGWRRQQARQRWKDRLVSAIKTAVALLLLWLAVNILGIMVLALDPTPWLK